MLTQGTRLGPYAIVTQIGAGGMGGVYRARDTRLGRFVAIKVLPSELSSSADRLGRFEQEARTVAALAHPNILAIHDVGVASVPSEMRRERGDEALPPGSRDSLAAAVPETVHYLVTELLEGEALGERLREGRLSVCKAVEIAVEIARGLAAAHAKGIVHRDLKPANVFLTRDGHVKILDFGLAKLASPEPAEIRAEATTVMEMTQPGAVVGTVGYMSPEQVRGDGVDQRTDIFAFGCVLYEMLHGQRAFVGGSPADTMSAILHDDPDGLAGGATVLPGPLRQILRRCLEKLPEDRFSSAHDLAFALEAATSDAIVTPPVDRARTARRRSLRWAVSLALGLVALALTAIWLGRSRGPKPLPQFHPWRVPGQLGNISEASVSPDGTQIAYTAGERDTSDVWVTDVRGGKPIRLTDGSTRAFGPAWFPDGGSVAFSADRGDGMSIWTVPRFGGSPLLLVPDAQDPAISPDGRRIAFVRADDGAFLRIWVAEIGAREGTRRLTGGGIGVWDHRHPAWSPDGRTICFQDARNLWLVPARGGTPRALTAGDDLNSSPAWSADGRSIYFASVRDGVQSLWRIPVSGGEARQVTHGAGTEASPTLSRGGRSLAFVAGPTVTTIALVDMQTGKVHQLRAGRTADFPTIAPDRSAIVFVSDLAGSSDLWSQELKDNAPMGEPTRLTAGPEECNVPAFSPDGKWIAYYSVIEGQRDIYVVPSHGGTPVKFTDAGKINMEPAWSPDGQRIAFVSDRGGSEQIWVAPVANGRRAGDAHQVINEEGTASYPTWSPDGKAIAYVVTVASEGEVRIVATVVGGPSRAVTRGAQARMVRWWWEKNVLLVSGHWGEGFGSIRLLSPAGGTPKPLVIPGHVAPDPDYPDFCWSLDGRLLALFERSKEAELWVLEAQQGLF